jgi:hypothetical protein
MGKRSHSSKPPRACQESNSKSEADQHHHSNPTLSQSPKLARWFYRILGSSRKSHTLVPGGCDTSQGQNTPSSSSHPKVTKLKVSKMAPIAKKSISRTFSWGSLSTVSDPLGKVAGERAFPLEHEHKLSWDNSKYEVLQILERNTFDNIGPKPVSLVFAYQVEYVATWTRQRKTAPTIIISCYSQVYGERLKKEVQKGFQRDLFDPAIKDFRVLAVKDRLQLSVLKDAGQAC